VGLAWHAVATSSPVVWEIDDPFDLSASREAVLTARSWLTARESTASVQVSLDGGVQWLQLIEVPTSATWTPIALDLSAYAGRLVHVRFVLDPAEPADADAGSWRVDDVHIVVSP
jgi:hypothetical protein